LRGGRGEEEEGIESVPLLLQRMRREVLEGEKARIVFSGLISLQEQQTHKAAMRNGSGLPPRHFIVRYAEDMGGKVFDHVDEGTTHVVAKRGETEKCKEGSKVVGCKVVGVNWLMDCFWRMKKVDTEPYLLAPVREGVKGKVKGGEKRKRGEEDDGNGNGGNNFDDNNNKDDGDDDEDDDFADELFDEL